MAAAYYSDQLVAVPAVTALLGLLQDAELRTSIADAALQSSVCSASRQSFAQVTALS
jgi:hypothetical protein